MGARRPISITLLATALIAGCGSTGSSGPAETVTIIETVDQQAGGETAPPPTSAEGDATATASTQATTGEVSRMEGLTQFTTPSGNIGCTLDRRHARCDIREFGFKPPAQPSGCDLEWGDSIEVGRRGPEFLCHGDTTFNDERTLPYGDAIEVESIRCDSASQGVTCLDGATGAGFTLSRDSYDLF